jgi:hypothetical protein
VDWRDLDPKIAAVVRYPFQAEAQSGDPPRMFGWLGCLVLFVLVVEAQAAVLRAVYFGETAFYRTRVA